MVMTQLFWTFYSAYHLRGQAQRPFASLQALKRDQNRRLHSIIAHAFRYVPYYREIMGRFGLRPGDFLQVEDLEKLPILEPNQIQRDPEYFVSTRQPLHRYLRLRSGGSTGMPRTVYHDTRAVLQNAAHGERERSIVASLVGKWLGYREAIIVAPVSTNEKVPRFTEGLRLLPRGFRIERQFLSLLDEPARTVELLNRFQPDVVHSYGSYVGYLFSHLERHGNALFRPKVITYSSDELVDSARRLITDKYGIPVLCTYQSVEAFKVGFQCGKHSGLHLNFDLYPLRVIQPSGATARPGEEGEVIISNLVNRATVLLNYRLGDLAAMLPETCPCRRSLPLISLPRGRSADWLQLPSGRIIHPLALQTAVKEEEQLWQFQLIQRTSSHFELLLVLARQDASQQIMERIAAKFFAICGDGVSCEIRIVDSIPRTASGKVRPVISL